MKFTKENSSCNVQSAAKEANDFQKYVVCSKSIEPLVGRNTFIDLEVQNLNPLQSSLLGNAHNSRSASAIVGNTSGTRLLEW
jgi:hypothetical protein